jgi:hypothetical protein
MSWYEKILLIFGDILYAALQNLVTGTGTIFLVLLLTLQFFFNSPCQILGYEMIRWPSLPCRVWPCWWVAWRVRRGAQESRAASGLSAGWSVPLAPQTTASAPTVGHRASDQYSSPREFDKILSQEWKIKQFEEKKITISIGLPVFCL